MTRLALLIFPVAALGACAPTTRALPAPSDAAQAWNDLQAEPCRQLIDLCADINFLPPSTEAATALRCSGSATTATCVFRVEGERCRARFWRTEAGGWEAQLSGVPRRLLVKCRQLRAP